MRADRRRGFTLIEMLVGLTLGALVVAFVHQAFGATVELAVRLDVARSAHGREVQARETLTRLFGSLAIGTPGAQGFDGGPHRAAFSSASDDGVHPVELTVRDGVLLVRTDDRVDTLLAAESVTFDYLMALGSDASWVAQWHSPLSAPLAVRLRLGSGDAAADTLFLTIGPRG